MYIRGLMEFRESAKAVLIVAFPGNTHSFSGNLYNLNAFLKVLLFLSLFWDWTSSKVASAIKHLEKKDSSMFFSIIHIYEIKK